MCAFGNVGKVNTLDEDHFLECACMCVCAKSKVPMPVLLSSGLVSLLVFPHYWYTLSQIRFVLALISVVVAILNEKLWKNISLN